MPMIIGLGNPGSKYAGTRHNVGFQLIDKLAQSLSVRLGPGKGPFHVGRGQHAGDDIILAKPSTYMNNSGDAVLQVINWYKQDIDRCLICYDDLNLEIGTLRLRSGGSAGGHNGVRDIIQKLGTRSFPRLRIGIGSDFPEGQQVRYVLSSFTPDEQEVIESVLEKAVEASFFFTRENIDSAMNKFN